MAHRLLKAGIMQKHHAFRILTLSAMLLAWAGVAQAGNVTLAWNPNADGATAGYKIYWGFQSGVYTASLDVGTPRRTSSRDFSMAPHTTSS